MCYIYFVMQEIHISYSELKSLAMRMIAHVGESTGVNVRDISVRHTINEDLGVDGDDADELLAELQQREDFQLEGFNFYDYFCDEAEIAGTANLWPVGYILSLPFVMLVYLLKTPVRAWSLQDLMNNTWPARPERNRSRHFPLPLSIGDLITSKLEGRFVPRNERRYVFQMKNRQHADGFPVTEQ